MLILYLNSPAEKLSEFELPARQLDAEIIDKFHSQSSEIHHWGRDHGSSISSEPPVIPLNLSGLSIAASSEDSENDPFQSFVQSPGSAQSSGSSPEELFDNHFQVESELLDELLQDSPAEDDRVTGRQPTFSQSQNLKKLQNQEDQRMKTMMNQGRGMLNLWK